MYSSLPAVSLWSVYWNLISFHRNANSLQMAVRSYLDVATCIKSVNNLTQYPHYIAPYSLPSGDEQRGTECDWLKTSGWETGQGQVANRKAAFRHFQKHFKTIWLLFPSYHAPVSNRLRTCCGGVANKLEGKKETKKLTQQDTLPEPCVRSVRDPSMRVFVWVDGERGRKEKEKGGECSVPTCVRVHARTRTSLSLVEKVCSLSSQVLGDATGTRERSPADSACFIEAIQHLGPRAGQQWAEINAHSLLPTLVLPKWTTWQRFRW